MRRSAISSVSQRPACAPAETPPRNAHVVGAPAQARQRGNARGVMRVRVERKRRREEAPTIAKEQVLQRCGGRCAVRCAIAV